MPGNRIEISRILDIIHRLRSGNSQTSICTDVGVTSKTVIRYRLIGEKFGWLSLERACPDTAEVEDKIRGIDSVIIEKYEKPILAPYKDIIMDWIIMEFTATKIHQLLNNKYGVEVGYTNVKRFCCKLKHDPDELGDYFGG